MPEEAPVINAVLPEKRFISNFPCHANRQCRCRYHCKHRQIANKEVMIQPNRETPGDQKSMEATKVIPVRNDHPGEHCLRWRKNRKKS
tara:strand:+ start:221 stop:484 length:264 start_codon:yes stop_codon:yes gene_type:complete